MRQLKLRIESKLLKRYLLGTLPSSSRELHHYPQLIDEIEVDVHSTKKPLKTKQSDVKQLIALHNKRQKILNLAKFGPVTSDTVLITIQVHNRIGYLTHLISSLKVASEISSALLIISHDVYDDEINKLVRSIDFCMVLQIFYPFSIQTHPKIFPGEDPKDCPRDTPRLEAEQMKCQNYESPDMYGHYREAKFTQMKHHWWWKLNRIYDQLEATKHHEGFLLLLEEDYYVAEDFIMVFKQLQVKMVNECSHCNIVSLGTYTESISTYTYNAMDVYAWVTNKHNMGMSFNKTTWRNVKSCSIYFCDYDEYNYDFSLQNVNRKCLEHKLFTAIIRGPRVYHIGECGIHHETKNCKADEKVLDVIKSLKSAKKKHQLYPESLKRGYIHTQHPTNEITPNGGWGDKRDRSLCLEMTLDVG